MKRLSPFIPIFILLLLPFELNPYWLRLLTSFMLLACLSYSHNLLFYFLGYPAFGGIAFFGFGAYAFSILYNSYNLPFPLSLILGGLSSSLLAILVAPIIMRLKSHYFAIATLALQLCLMELAQNLEITGGTMGIAFNVPKDSNLISYYSSLILLSVLLLLTLFLERSRLGLTIKAIREDEITAMSIGINTTLYRSLAFVIMALFLGIAGGVFSFWNAYVDAPTLFNPMLSVKTFFILTLSLSSPVHGPLLWSFIFEAIFEMLWSRFLVLHGLFLGLAIVLLILTFPKGISWKRF